MNKELKQTLYYARPVTCVLLLTLVFACSQPQQTRTLVARDNQWVAGLADRSKDDLDRICLESSLNTGLAMVDFVDAKFSDSQIKSALLKGTTQGVVRDMRVRDYEAWRTTHSISGLSEQHLIACLSENGHQVARDPQLVQCFYVTEPAAAFSLYKRYGRTLPASVALVKQRYNDLDKGDHLDSIGKQVFGWALGEQVLNDRLQTFSRCLRVPREHN
jgi:hypothetical protein